MSVIDLIDNVIARDGDAMRWAPDREPEPDVDELSITMDNTSARDVLLPLTAEVVCQLYDIPLWMLADKSAFDRYRARLSRMHSAYRRRRR